MASIRFIFAVVISIVLITMVVGDDWRQWKKSSMNLAHLWEPKIKFAFILVNSGMHTLDYPGLNSAKTYPNDVNYKDEWNRVKKGDLLEPGEVLMTFVGRSLYSRYAMQMNGWTKYTLKVSKPAKKDYITRSGHALYTGFSERFGDNERNTFGHLAPKVASFDKTELFYSPSDCKCYQKLLEATKEREKEILEQNMEFLQYLNSQIGANENPDWDLTKSLERVYWLWTILQVEDYGRVQKKDRTPRWMKDDDKENIKKIVKEYLKLSIKGHPDMTKYLIATMFEGIHQSMEENQAILHFHVTEDRTFSAFKSALTGTDPLPTPFGESIMIEVYQNGQAAVVGIKPIINNGLLTYPAIPGFNNNYESLRTYLSGTLSLPMNENKWKELCESEP